MLMPVITPFSGIASISDSFTGSNGDPIDGRSTETGGKTWSVFNTAGNSANAEIQSNMMQAPPSISVTSNLYATVDKPWDNIQGSYDFYYGGGTSFIAFVGVMPSGSSDSDQVGVRMFQTAGPDVIEVIEKISGTVTVLDSASYSATAGSNTGDFSFNGNTFTATVGATTVTATTTNPASYYSFIANFVRWAGSDHNGNGIDDVFFEEYAP